MLEGNQRHYAFFENASMECFICSVRLLSVFCFREQRSFLSILVVFVLFSSSQLFIPFHFCILYYNAQFNINIRFFFNFFFFVYKCK